MLGSEEQGEASGPFISQLPSMLGPGRGCIQGCPEWEMTAYPCALWSYPLRLCMSDSQLT